MSWLCYFLIMCCAGSALAFDLGPMVRIAQCRIQCLRAHSTDGTCDWYANRAETLCSECWQNCENLETQWESSKSICEEIEYNHCPACQTACEYRKTRVEEEYLPSGLSAPLRGPVKLNDQDVAILMRRTGSTWRENGYYPGSKVPSLRQDFWIIAVLDDGSIKHYSWAEWTPTLESLKQGPFVEASLSWTDVDVQLKKQREAEQKKFNDRIRQFYLEKYGEKVLGERSDNQHTAITEEVFRRFFFRRRWDNNGDESQPSSSDNVRTDTEDIFGQQPKNRLDDSEESYVVSWEPETGGLMGNQVVDTATSAQISLLPGMKYLVRIASNDGPGSFPIEVDTRPNSVNIWWLKKKLDISLDQEIDTTAVAAAVILFLVLLVGVVIVKVTTKRKVVDVNQV